MGLVVRYQVIEIDKCLSKSEIAYLVLTCVLVQSNLFMETSSYSYQLLLSLSNMVLLLVRLYIV